MIITTSDFGFKTIENMKIHGFFEKSLDLVNEVDWVATKDFNNIAKNHCGAVAVTNIIMYLDKKYRVKEKSNKLIFRKVHKTIGNGPIFNITYGLKAYYKSLGKDLTIYKVKNVSEYKRAIHNNMPVGILVANGVKGWHWIVGIGYRQYKNGELYFIVKDGWTKKANRYYMINKGSRLLTATAYGMAT